MEGWEGHCDKVTFEMLEIQYLNMRDILVVLIFLSGLVGIKDIMRIF